MGRDDLIWRHMLGEISTRAAKACPTPSGEVPAATALSVQAWNSPGTPPRRQTPEAGKVRGTGLEPARRRLRLKRTDDSRRLADQCSRPALSRTSSRVVSADRSACRMPSIWMASAIAGTPGRPAT